MKRIIFLVVSLVFTASIKAEGIDRNTALKKAQRFMPGKEFSTGKALPSARAKAPRKNDAFYIFNAKNDGGYVIVSGDDRTTEILGYAQQGHLDVDQIPENLKWWLDSYARQIEALGTSLTPAKHSGMTQGAPIAPLITAQWAQRAPYNYMCPDGNYVDFNEEGYDADNRCATGCVATAIAQVMYYWKWPETCPAIDGYLCREHSINALPSTTFKWDLMKDTYSAQETGKSADAVAELMRYCGQGSDMIYGTDGSSTIYDLSKMVSIFQYSPNCYELTRDRYSTEQWESLIYDELAAHRPVLFKGLSFDAGHAFIVDGYDENGLFHINWGWGGKGNSYFLLTIADPRAEEGGPVSDVAFEFQQDAIFGLKPAESDEIMQPRLTSIVHTNSNKTYTRQSPSDNFKDVELAGFILPVYTITPSHISNYEVGWALYNNDTCIQQFGSKKISVESNEPFYNYLKVSFGANLSEGEYQLYQTYRLNGEVEWKRCKSQYKGQYMLLAEITPTTMSVRIPETDYVVNSISFLEEPEVGSTLNINANIINTGDFYNDIFLLEIQKPGDSQWVTIDKVASHLEPGECGDFLFSFVPDQAGTIPARIKTNSSIGSDKTLKTFTIKIAATEKITLNNVTYLCTPEYGHAKVVENADADNTAKTVTILSSIISGGVECKVFSIERFAFDNRPNLSEITIPESIEHIDSWAFLGNNFSSVVSHIQNPPVIDEITFKRSEFNKNTSQYDYYPSPATLYVPIGTKAKYEAISGWAQFAKIEEGDPAETKIGNLRYSYATGGSTATVIQDESYQQLTEVVVPATVTIDGRTYQVTAIGKYAFRDNSLTEITLPSTLKSIEEGAFYSCDQIQDLVIPEGVTSIGNFAFAYMGNLKKLELPSSLKEIGKYVLLNNSSLAAVVSHITDPYAISDKTFASSPATLYVPIGTKEKYEALSGWTQFAKIVEGEPAETKIGDLRYSYVTGGSTATVIQDESYKQLVAVVIPSTITIGDRSYQVTAIGSEAFYQCQKLKTISLPEGLQNIGNNAFHLNNSITEITLPSTLKSIEEGAFYYCYQIQDLVIPEGVTSIGNFAFAYMGNLKKLELPSSLKEIGENVILNNSSLAAVVSHISEPFAVSDKTFVNQSWNYDTQQYDYTPSPATLYVPIGTKEKYEALSGWTQFAKIVEGEPAETKIGDLRYSYVTGGSTATVIQDESYKELTAVTIPSTITIGNRNYQVTAIDNNAFYLNNSITEVTLPSTLKVIGNYSFFACSKIETLAVPEGVEHIGDWAFAYMNALKKLELPSTLKGIGERVITGNSSLTSVVSHITEPFTVSDNTFASSPATLYVPIGTKEKYEALSGWTQFAKIEEGEPAETKIGDLRYSYVTGGSTATVIQDESYKELTAVTIPSTITIGDRSYQVTAIDDYAFAYCLKLVALTLSEGLQSIGKNAFASNGFSELTFPSTLRSIGDNAFINCTQIKTLVIPEGVETIGYRTFAYMWDLKYLELPSTLKEIGEGVVESSSDLTSVVSHITEPFAVSDNTFASSSATLYVPIGTKAKYEALSGWTQFAEIVEGEPEPDGIISIKNEKINKKSETSAGAWYNLQGIQVSKPQKGVYLRNHKKYFSK